MKRIVCDSCGGSSFIEKGNIRICEFCGARYKISGSNIDLNEDIVRLLNKCKEEPWNAKKYAGLILDIDPTNKEAKEILR